MKGAPISENEGRTVQCGPHTFRIVNGVRVWQSPVPQEHLREIVPDPYHNDRVQRQTEA